MIRRALPVLFFTAAACSMHDEVRDEAPKPVAIAKLEAKSGATVTGQAELFVTGMEVRLELKVSGTMPGKHAVHVHAVGDCSADDGESAGPHWNPDHHMHGQLDSPPAHLGDIGNLEVRGDGRGTLVFSTSAWSIGTKAVNDVMGKALVIHASDDDFASQPAGNSGKRIACGVVRKPGSIPFLSASR